MWDKACEYIDKTIDKLKELNPFQKWAEEKGGKLYDAIWGNPSDKVTGTTRLPISRGVNINSEQKNNITINTNESAKAVKNTIERYSKDLIPSYVPQMN